jgi:hypothetical protein
VLAFAIHLGRPSHPRFNHHHWHENFNIELASHLWVDKWTRRSFFWFDVLKSWKLGEAKKGVQGANESTPNGTSAFGSGKNFHSIG